MAQEDGQEKTMYVIEFTTSDSYIILSLEVP